MGSNLVNKMCCLTTFNSSHDFENTSNASDCIALVLTGAQYCSHTKFVTPFDLISQPWDYGIHEQRSS